MRSLRHLPLETLALLILGMLIFWIALMLLAAPVLQAQTGDEFAQPTGLVTDDQVNAIAQKLYCPVCENITLDTCGTAACADWRYEIRLQLEQGKTEQQIIEDFVLRFGDRVVGTPLDPALRLLSLATPWVMIAVSLYLGVRFYHDRSRPHPHIVTASPAQSSHHSHEATPQDRYRDMLEHDLK